MPLPPHPRQSHLDQHLHDVAEMRGDDSLAMAELLAEGANPLLACSFGETPLILASMRGNVKCVELLLPVSHIGAECSFGFAAQLSSLRKDRSRGVAPFMTSTRHTALSLAALHGQAQCVKSLLPFADPAAWAAIEGHGDMTPLMLAAMGAGYCGDAPPRRDRLMVLGDAHREAAALLIDAGLPLARNAKWGAGALAFAARSERADIFQLLLPHSDLGESAIASILALANGPEQRRLADLARAYRASRSEARQIDSAVLAEKPASPRPFGRL